jgi:hypothetical protein
MIVIADDKVIREELSNMAQALQFAAQSGECLSAEDVRITKQLPPRAAKRKANNC